jgi:hypothetical protein
VGRQALTLRALLPTADITVRASTLTAFFELQPTTSSRRYRIQLHYQHGTTPDVTVVHPNLTLRDNAASLPHTYPDDKLCLHLPRQWRPSMLLAVVPWTSEWLLYYEIWLATGTWHGGGHGTPA